MRDNLKVLMLGWEFPPVMSGGLGVACYNLAYELKKIVDLTLIIPRSDPDFIVENLEIIGLNTLKNDYIKNYDTITETYYQSFPEIHVIETNINPYESDYELITRQKTIKTDHSRVIEEKEEKENIFAITDELYGHDLKEKINQYNNMVLDIVHKKEFDVIHAHDWMTFSAALQIKELTGKPLFLHAHSLEVNRKGTLHQTGIFRIEQKGMKKADAVITVSHHMRRVIAEKYDIYPGKIYPVHNGPEGKKGYRKASNFNEKIVLFLGRITHQKGPEIFFDIATKILNHEPNVRFIMAGTGNLKEKIVEMVAYQRIGHKFHFTGFIDDNKIEELLAMADVLIMPSVDDPFGLAALEAAEFGVPCIISEESGVKEVLLNGALKAHYWDINKNTDNALALLRDEHLREEIIKKAKEEVSNLSWENSAKQIVNIYTEIAN